MPTLSTEQAISIDLQGILIDAVPFGIAPTNILVRELPKVGEEIDQVPCILIAPYQQVEHDYFGMEQTRLLTYHIEIAVVDGANGDFATNQDLRQSWQEAVIKATEVNDDGSWRLLLPNVPQVYSIQTDRVLNADRSELNQNYSYLSVVVRVYTNEP